MRTSPLFVAATLLVSAAGCGTSALGTSSSHPSRQDVPSPAADTSTPDHARAAAVRCHALGSGFYVLPDPSCTPGAANPTVWPADIESTICRSGWTASVRPPVSYTDTLKRRQMAEYGDTGLAADYEEDHLIPLELGGAPADPANLWPEPGASPNPKDEVEDAARRTVCDDRVPLGAAQKAIAKDWISFGQKLGVLSTG